MGSLMARIRMGNQEYIAVTKPSDLLIEASRLLEIEKDCLEIRNTKVYVKMALQSLGKVVADDR